MGGGGGVRSPWESAITVKRLVGLEASSGNAQTADSEAAMGGSRVQESRHAIQSVQSPSFLVFLYRPRSG